VARKGTEYVTPGPVLLVVLHNPESANGDVILALHQNNTMEEVTDSLYDHLWPDKWQSGFMM
jgi:hypothetical protein